MVRFIAPLAALTVAVLAVPAIAQGPYNSHRSYNHPPAHGHNDWHHDTHRPNVAQLDSYADRLAKIASHLHDDAHELSQDYHHSAAIEQYVDSVDRLQQHMHAILHEASETRYLSSALINHIRSDLRETKSLFRQLYGQLQHQGLDGARTEDYYTMSHMRQIIIQEAFPLIRRMESALDGGSHYTHLHPTHSRPNTLMHWLKPRLLNRH